MQPTTASRTAIATSLMRALHTRTDPVRIVDDPWGDRLVPAIAREAIRQRAVDAAVAAGESADHVDPGAFVDRWLRGSMAYANVITRSRYAEDALRAFVARGGTQYVLVGAGFDSFALRTPPEVAHVRVFEVDHPATQALKRQCIAGCGATVREPVHFIAADLSAETLESALQRSAFDAAQPTFFAWLGVTMYLTRDANLRALRAMAGLGAAGNELVFTYVDQAAFERGEIAESDLGRSVAAIGEPFLSGFDPHALPRALSEVGFTLLEDLDDSQVVHRYDPQGLNRLQPVPVSRIAHARTA